MRTKTERYYRLIGRVENALWSCILTLGFRPQKIGTFVLFTQETLCENGVVAISLYGEHKPLLTLIVLEPWNIDLDKNL